MEKENFTYEFESSKTPDQVFQLLLQVPQWWSGIFEETIEGKSEKTGDEFSFRAGGGMHYTKQKLTELVPDQKIVWQVTESNLTFLDNPGEWKGTKLSFAISPGKNKTQVKFMHEGLRPEVECWDACSAGWTQYLKNLENKLK